MYKMYGDEFTELVNRNFTDNFGVQENSIEKNGFFSCKADIIKSETYNVLHFRSSFQRELEVNNFKDFNHTSFHFQLKGYSDADISGFKHALPLHQGDYNIMNCVDPISNFKFPKQLDYAYICVGINPKHLITLLEHCGMDWKNLTDNIQFKRPFALLEKPRQFNMDIKAILDTIINPSIADSLKRCFLKNKVDELILLTLDDTQKVQNVRSNEILSKRDIASLYDLKYFLDAHYLESFTLSYLAKQVYLNEFKLKKGFKLLFNYTVFGYIHHLRMLHGMNLLKERELRVTEIAALLGYFSDASFSRAFKRYFGCKPTDLKN